jgi:glyoxylate reductase
MVALKKHFSINSYDKPKPLAKPELIHRLKGMDGVISMLSDTFDPEVLQKSPSLQIISNYAVGYNNIDLSEAKKRSIMVTNTPGVLTEATCDLTWSLLLGVARRIVEGDQLVRKGKWKGWAPTLLLGQEIYGKTLGIIGMGRIGQGVARRGLGFGMKIFYHNRSRLTQKMEKSLKAQWVSLPILLKKSDFISLHTPLTIETYHWIGKKELGLMKPTAILINTARGPIIDEKALVTALKRKTIAGAGLDVFEKEPKLSRGLRNTPNTLLLPHLGSGTVETRIRMGMLVLENLKAFFKGRRPPHAIHHL